MIKVGEQGIFISDTAAKKLSPYILSQFKKTLVLDLNALQAFTETDPIFQAWLATPPNVSTFTNDAGYLTSFTETDPVYTASSWYSTTNNSSNWNTAFSWGNHASAGYLTSITSGQVTAALGYTPYDATNPSGYITSSSLSSYVPTARTLTINGTTYDLTADRSWTISTGTTYTFSTGLTNIVGTITSNLSVGVSGGQSVIGGTASGNNLTLSSTSNATKGKIIFGTSAYDEVNNSLGIGTTTPNWKLHVAGTVGADNIIAQFGDANKGVNIKTLANGTGLITSWSYAPTDPSAIAISAGANFGFNAAPNNFYGMGLGAARNGKYDMWFQTGTTNGGGYRWYTGGTNERMTINKDGNVGIGTTTPTALLMLAAGTATAGTAPLKFTSGTNLTTPENGAFEFDGTNLYFTTGGVRKTVTLI